MFCLRGGGFDREAHAVQPLLFDCARRYQHLSTQSAAQPRDVEGEHRAIMDAVLARDADLAVKLHDAHITRTVDIVADMT